MGNQVVVVNDGSCLVLMILIKCGVGILICGLIFQRLRIQVLLQTLPYIVLLRNAKGGSDIRVVCANPCLIVREGGRLDFEVDLTIDSVPGVQTHFLELSVQLLKRFLICVGLQGLVYDRTLRCYIHLTLAKENAHSLVTSLGLSKFLSAIAY